MAELFYAVTATLPSEDLAREYIDWLTGGHLDGVLAGGATSAQVVRLDDDTEGEIRVATQYLFPDREAFAAYERDHAPALRADGRKRFGDKGVRFDRATGEVATHGDP